MDLIRQKKADLEKRVAEINERIKTATGEGTIQNAVAQYSRYLSEIENDINSSIEKSKEYYRIITEENQTLRNNQVLKDRYENLRSQYIADIKRLSNIADGERLLSSYPDSSKCPICGVGEIPDALLVPHLNAAKAELKRTINLLSDLEEAENSINHQIEASLVEITRLERERKLCNSSVNNTLKLAAESLRQMLARFEESTIMNQRITLYGEMLSDLEKDRTLIEMENKIEGSSARNNQYKPKEYFQKDLVDSLTGYAQKILQFCNYHKAQDTSFSLESFDLQVSGIEKALVHYLNSKSYRDDK